MPRRPVCLPDEHEAIGFGESKGPHEYGVDQRKDGGVGADREREGQDGNGCQAGMLTEHPHPIANILHEPFDPRPSWRVFAREIRELRLPQRSQVPRQHLVPQLCERYGRRLFVRGAAGQRVSPPIVEILGEFVDDLVLARR